MIRQERTFGDQDNAESVPEKSNVMPKRSIIISLNRGFSLTTVLNPERIQQLGIVDDNPKLGTLADVVGVAIKHYAINADVEFREREGLYTVHFNITLPPKYHADRLVSVGCRVSTIEQIMGDLDYDNAVQYNSTGKMRVRIDTWNKGEIPTYSRSKIKRLAFIVSGGSRER